MRSDSVGMDARPRLQLLLEICEVPIRRLGVAALRYDAWVLPPPFHVTSVRLILGWAHILGGMLRRSVTSWHIGQRHPSCDVPSSVDAQRYSAALTLR